MEASDNTLSADFEMVEACLGSWLTLNKHSFV